MILKKPTKYIIKISKIGFDTLSIGMKGIMQDENPYNLAKRVVLLMADSFARDNKGDFVYQLALELLCLLKVDKSTLLKDLEQTRLELEKRNQNDSGKN